MATTAVTDAPLVPLAEVEADTLLKLFLAPLEQHSDTAGMLYKERGEWRTLVRREIAQRVERLAGGLQALGITTGERVAILSENRPEWAIADYAALCLGAVVVPIYATLPPNQIAYILNDSRARLIFVSTRLQLAKIIELRDRLPALETIIAFEDPNGATGVQRLADIEAIGTERRSSDDFPGLAALSSAIGRDDLATLIYTSGTTGDPKGVMLTHFNIASNIAAARQHKVFDLGPDQIALSFLPLSHAFERLLDYYYWHVGATIAYVDAFDKVAASMAEVRPHIIGAAPRVFEKIYTRVMGARGVKAALLAWAQRVGEESVAERLSGRRSGPRGFREKLADRLVFSKLRARTGGRVQAFISGSAPLSAEIARFFWAAGIPVYEGYGLTESSPVLTVNRPGQVRLGSVGLALPGTELRVGPEGEILARGPQIMQGYFEKAEATAEALDGDGWLHTGDIGLLDEEGFLWITDRIKNIIVTAGGKNIAPAPIENTAALSPYVAQLVMIGDKRPFPALLIVPDFENLQTWAKEQGISDTAQAALARDPRVHEMIEQDTLGRLTSFAPYEVPKKIAIVPREFTIDSGELTPSLKVRRDTVEENYADVIDEIYS